MYQLRLLQFAEVLLVLEVVLVFAVFVQPAVRHHVVHVVSWRPLQARVLLLLVLLVPVIIPVFITIIAVFIIIIAVFIINNSGFYYIPVFRELHRDWPIELAFLQTSLNLLFLFQFDAVSKIRKIINFTTYSKILLTIATIAYLIE